MLDKKAGDIAQAVEKFLEDQSHSDSSAVEEMDAFKGALTLNASELIDMPGMRRLFKVVGRVSMWMLEKSGKTMEEAVKLFRDGFEKQFIGNEEALAGKMAMGFYEQAGRKPTKEELDILVQSQYLLRWQVMNAPPDVVFRAFLGGDMTALKELSEMPEQPEYLENN
jgi:hypothetical protein